MLRDFLSSNRSALISRCRAMVALRSEQKNPSPEFEHGIPVFIDQVIRNLTVQQTLTSPHGRPEIGSRNVDPQVGSMATLHGRDLLREGFSLEEVIRDYGDVCQAVTSLAVETGATISAEEFHTFNRCLDDAMAAAVTEYSRVKERSPAESPSAFALEPRIDDLGHLENALNQTQLALASSEAALTAAQQEAHEAQTRSLHDSLTGLPNRELFDDRLAKAIALASRHGWTLAVMFLDLDGFKNVNDLHGHAAGDVVLKNVAERLQRRVRDEDTVCRNGGDEFLYLLMNPGEEDNLERIAKLVSLGIAQPMFVSGLEISIKASVGIAVYPTDGCTGNDLIKNADIAMYRAKKCAGGVVLFGHQTA